MTDSLSFNPKQVHRQAMILAQDALLAKQNGDSTTAFQLYSEAFELERKAALSFLNEENKEPTRSVLFRSAASLALNCQRFRDAEKMIGLGLAGNPPNDIADELRNLYEDVNFFRHLALKDTSLDETSFLFSLSGDAVGYGMISASEFKKRFDVLEKMTYRTAERKLHVSYRVDGTVPKNIQERYEPYFAAPMAASFAVAVKIGRPSEQTEFSFEDNASPKEVVEELVSCIDLVNRAAFDELKTRINDESYYQNFVRLSKELAPDGERVKTVGFTLLKNGQEKPVALRRRQDDLKEVVSGLTPLPKTERPIPNDGISRHFTYEGILKVANGKKNQIEIVPQKGKINKAFKNRPIIVPEGIADIVRLHFDELIVATLEADSDFKTYLLRDINKVN